MTQQAKRLTPEQLMIERVICIAQDTTGKLEVGAIYYRYYFKTSNTGAYCYVTNPESPLQGSTLSANHAENFPHLFRHLNWWEHRTPDQMPEYVQDKQGVIWKVEAHFRNSINEYNQYGCRVVGKDWPYCSYRNLIPATLQDYTQYITNLNANQ